MYNSKYENRFCNGPAFVYHSRRHNSDNSNMQQHQLLSMLICAAGGIVLPLCANNTIILCITLSLSPSPHLPRSVLCAQMRHLILILITCITDFISCQILFYFCIFETNVKFDVSFIKLDFHRNYNYVNVLRVRLHFGLCWTNRNQ